MMKPKIAVVHLLPSPYRMPLFLRLLRDEDLDVRLFFTDTQAANRPTWTAEGIPVDPRVTRMTEFRLPGLTRGSDSIRFNSGILKIFEWHPDVVLVCGPNETTPILAALISILRNVPYVILAEVSNSNRWSLARKLSLPLAKLITSRATKLTPASESCARYFSRLGGDRRNMTVLPCVPDVTRLGLIAEELGAEGAATRKSLGLEGRFVLLFVGRLVENKGVRELLAAMDTIREKAPHVTLVVVGYGKMNEFVQQECYRLGQSAKHIGFVNDDLLHKYYSVADLHIMPSWDEPYGVVCAEALSFGVPSIVTETSGCVDLVEDGVNGFIIPPRDIKAIEASVLRVANNKDLHQDLKRHAKSTIEGLTMDYLYGELKKTLLSACKEGKSISGNVN